MADDRRSYRKLQKLASLWPRAKSLLIVMQDNPDPDAIAAAAALRKIANRQAGISCQLAYGGTIGRAENRELAEYLGLNFRPFAEIEPTDSHLIALVDTQPQTGNNPLPPEITPQIVIDHHPIRRLTRKSPFTDIRSNYGATSTILWEYLQAAEIATDIQLATALLYGIRSDTQDLGRESTRADALAMEALYPLANKRMLSQIQRGRVPSAYYQMLVKALNNTTIYEYCAISDLGEIDNPDMVGEVADLLLRHESVSWSICYGRNNSRMVLSLRTQDRRLEAGRVMHTIVHRLGTGGGHSTMAGGQIAFRPDKQARTEHSRISQLIRRRLLKKLGLTECRGRQLIKPRNGD